MTSGDESGRGASIDIGTLNVGPDGRGLHLDLGGKPDPRFSTLPSDRRDAPFTGRAAELVALDEAFADRGSAQVAVLHGSPGVGKSRLAVEWARQHRVSYPGGTFFIRLDAAPPPELAQLARVLGLPAYPDERIEDQCRRVLAHLGGKPTLLVYDNVADERILGDWLPPGDAACHVLATSTCTFWSAPWIGVPVELFPDPDARTLIGKLVTAKGAAEKYAGSIVDKARGVTIELCSVAKSVEYEVRHGREGAIHAALMPGTESSFGGAWRLLTEDARLLLKVACLFTIARIPPDALRALFVGEGWDEGRINAALDAGRDRGLLTQKGEAFEAHQLVARFVGGQEVSEVSSALWRRHFEAFVEAAEAFGERPGDAKRGERLLAYPVEVGAWCGAILEDVLAARALGIGRGLWEGGRFDEALPWAERSVEARQKGVESGSVDHESLSASLHYVGSCHSCMGRYGEALQWFERAVEATQKGDIHGRVDHESLGKDLHQVGICHSSTGRYAEALPWFERAVEAGQKGDIHGRVDHASLGRSLHQVGFCYSSTGRYAEALPWFERAVEAGQKGDIHGRVDHASLGISLHQVGFCHWSTGRYAEALPWFERAVEAGQKGDIHGRVDQESLRTSLKAVRDCRAKLGLTP